MIHDGKNRTTKSRKIRMLGEQESYKYLGILEVNTLIKVVMKEKLKKNISGKQENYSKPNYRAGILSKG